MGGSYFLTFNVKKPRPKQGPLLEGPLGRIAFGEMILSAEGHAVVRAWNLLPQHFRTVEIDTFVVMPDHFHGLLHLRPGRQGTHWDFKPLAQIVGALKTMSAKEINVLRGQPGAEFWHRGFYDRMIRDPSIEGRVRNYINNNPAVLFRRVLARDPAYGSGGSRPATTIGRVVGRGA